MLSRVILVIVTQNLFILSVLAQLHGTSPNWIDPIRLPKANLSANASKGGTGQNLIRLSTGELIQLYYEDNSITKKFYFAKSTDDGATWTLFEIDTPFVFTPPVSGIFSPTLCKDKEDNIHVVWATQPFKHIYYAKFDKNFNIIIDTVRITQFIYHDFVEGVYVTADQNNRIHIMWHDGDVRNNSNSAYFTKVMYRQSPDGGLTWNNQIILSDTAIYKHAAFPRANFFGCSGDTVAVPWRQEVTVTNWDVWIAVSTDGGNTWNRVLVAGTDSMEWDPGVVVDRNNRIHLHYHEYKKSNLLMSSMEYLYSDDAGLTWSSVISLSPQDIRSQLSVFAYDPESDMQAICWKDERDFVNASKTRADVMCTFTTDGGATWQEPEFVTDLDTIPVGYKSVEVGNNGKVYVTFEYKDPNSGLMNLWFSKREQLSYIVKAEKGQVRVYYKQGKIKLMLSDNLKYPVMLTILDIGGRSLKEKIVLHNIVEEDFSDFPTGMYFFYISDIPTGQKIAWGKLSIW